MRIRFGMIALLFFSMSASAQSDAKLTAKDSAQLMQELMQLLDSSDNPGSYVTLSVGMGNRLFSINNRSLNAKQATNNSFIITPGVAYNHKSGFGLSATANMLREPGKNFSINQYALSPSFDLQNDSSFDVGISYTRYFVKNYYSSYASPIQNDFYASLAYKKTWVKPGIALGYSTGTYKESRVLDTLGRRLYDSVTNQLKSFSLILSVAHDFDWYGVISSKDALLLTPTLMLNMGSSTVNISHKTNAVNLFNFLNRRNKIPKIQTTSFKAESIGFDLSLNYQIGKFAFQPDCYLDYYLPKSDTNKFTQVFTFTIGYSW